jgi:hypothetical protein
MSYNVQLRQAAEIALRAADELSGQLPIDMVSALEPLRHALREAAKGRPAGAVALVAELRDLARNELLAEYHSERTSIRDHHDPNQRSWVVGDVTTCTDPICRDALRLVAAADQAIDDGAELRATLAEWVRENPWQREPAEGLVSTAYDDWTCYTCGAAIKVDEPTWDEPPADAPGHDAACLWLRSRALLEDGRG